MVKHAVVIRNVIISEDGLYVFDDKKIVKFYPTAEEAILVSFYLLKANEDKILHKKMKIEEDVNEIVDDLIEPRLTEERAVEMTIEGVEKMIGILDALEDITDIIKIMERDVLKIEKL
ncbi:MAG: hypothetical protein QXH21_09695 [Ignisphaera sp.]